MQEYKSARYACGGSQHEDKTYPAHQIELQAGDKVYLFTDGAIDQFGGPNGRKLGSKNLKKFLTESAHLPMKDQGRAFEGFINEWMSKRKQLDDVLLVGIAV